MCMGSGRVGVARKKSEMLRICKLDIACEHLAIRRRTSSTSTRVLEVGQGVTKKGAEFGSGGNRISRY